MNPLLTCKELSFAYNSAPVLEQVSISIARGDMVALLGANGAGKSTLLKICAGLLAAGQGEVLFEDRPLSAYARRELARRIALVPQEMHVSFDFTVEELVSQGRTPYLSFLGGLQPSDRGEIARAVELAGIEHLAARKFNELSGGERQRVKVALALAQNPQLLLLDEPAQHLDIGRQAEVFALLRKLNQWGLTIVAAVHDLQAAHRHFSSAILLFPNGSCVCGTPGQVLTAEAIRAAFGVDYRACECEQPKSATEARRHSAAEPQPKTYHGGAETRRNTEKTFREKSKNQHQKQKPRS